MDAMTGRHVRLVEDKQPERPDHGPDSLVDAVGPEPDGVTWRWAATWWAERFVVVQTVDDDGTRPHGRHHHARPPCGCYGGIGAFVDAACERAHHHDRPEPTPVACPDCWGNGWVPRYGGHSDDCETCGGKGTTRSRTREYPSQ